MILTTTAERFAATLRQMGISEEEIAVKLEQAREMTRTSALDFQTACDTLIVKLRPDA